MLKLAVGALLVSLVAGAVGFTGMARGAGVVARVAFAVFLVVALVLFAAVLVGIDLLT
ncbi:MAG: DUF1328 domain-containing protein [Gemmatimonadota bacterium]